MTNKYEERLGTERMLPLVFQDGAACGGSTVCQSALQHCRPYLHRSHFRNPAHLALTGVGVCMPLIMIVSAFAALVGSGGAPRASIHMGKQDYDQAEKILGNCFTLQVVISVILTANFCFCLTGSYFWLLVPAKTRLTMQSVT